jgi:hypothetical protein
MYHMARLRRLLMEWRRWTWRLAVASPVVLLGALIAGFASTGAAQAQNPATSPTPCPSPTSLVSGVTGTVCQTVQSVTSQTSNVTGTVGNTVSSVTGWSGAATGSAAGGSTAAGSQAHRAGSHAQRHAHRANATSPATAVGAPLAVGGLSPLGLPGWLFQPGIGALPPPSAAPVQLNLPEIHPAAQAATAAKPTGKAPNRLWLVIVFGAVGLVGGAGGHFLGWPGLRRRGRSTA